MSRRNAGSNRFSKQQACVWWMPHPAHGSCYRDDAGEQLLPAFAADFPKGDLGITSSIANSLNQLPKTGI